MVMSFMDLSEHLKIYSNTQVETQKIRKPWTKKVRGFLHLAWILEIEFIYLQSS